MRIFRSCLCAIGCLLLLFLLSPTARAERILPDEPSPGEGGQEVQRLLPTEEPATDAADRRARDRVRLDRLMSDSAAMRRTIRRLRREIARLRADSATMRQQMRTLQRRLDERGTGELRDGPPPPEGSSEDVPFEASPENRYNPNTASLEDLRSIPGLTDPLAERIEWYRREVQPFQNRNDLRRVPGIDRRVYRKIAAYFHEGPYR